MPSMSPSNSPTDTPSMSPSNSPTDMLYMSPSDSPADTPSMSPSDSPTDMPSMSPINSPTDTPSMSPSNPPTDTPSMSPINSPTDTPSMSPINSPSDSPTYTPSISPSDSPTDMPSMSPSDSPTYMPSMSPSDSPTNSPTDTPSISPSDSSTDTPSMSPSNSPTDTPSMSPSDSPTDMPSISPSDSPTDTPSMSPIYSPSYMPSLSPTSSPSLINSNPLDPEANCSFNVHLYVDVSNSVESEASKRIARMIKKLLSQWFDLAGDGTPILEKKVSVKISAFASSLNSLNNFESQSASNGKEIMRLFRTISKFSRRGTRTDLLFRDLLAFSPRTVTRSLVILLTDGAPYIVESRHVKKNLLEEAGLPSNVGFHPRSTGLSLHFKYLSRFRAANPLVLIVGMSFNRLPELFLQQTFDSYFIEDAMEATVGAWADHITYLMCEDAAIASSPPTLSRCPFEKRKQCNKRRGRGCRWSKEQGSCYDKNLLED